MSAGDFAHRPATAGDAAAAAELMNTFDRAYVEDPDTMTAEEVVDWWSRLDLSRDTRFYFGDGRLAGIATVYPREEGMLDLDAFVHPDFAGRGLGSAMIDWLEEESRGRGYATARTSAVTTDTAAGELIAAREYAPIRHFYRMAIRIEAPPAEPQWPAGFAVATLQAGEEETLHAVVQESFAEHWGHEYRPFEDWRNHHLDREWWDPTLVWLVREGETVVAELAAAFRFGSGWVNTVGTLKPWRGQGLGRALLLTAFGEFHRRGERRIALAVDAANETGATHLYESVGMRIVWQADVYEKRL